MNSIYALVAPLTVIALIGTIGATLQQTSAIIDNWREEFRILTDDFEDAISNASDQEPRDLESIQQLVDDYKTNLTKIFEGSDNLTARL